MRLFSTYVALISKLQNHEEVEPTLWNSYETEEIAEITEKRSAFNFCHDQIYRQGFFAINSFVVYVHYKDLLLSLSQDFFFFHYKRWTNPIA